MTRDTDVGIDLASKIDLCTVAGEIRPRRCLTPDEYARERKVSVRTVYRLIHSGALPAERIGRQWRVWVRMTGQSATAPPDETHID